jgi:hypothetical protein
MSMPFLCYFSGFATHSLTPLPEGKKTVNVFVASMTGAGVGYFAARAAIAMTLGAVIGLERQWRQRIAVAMTGTST